MAAFFICCVVSTATGTSLGTLLVCGPLLYPAGGPLGAAPTILAGAIIGGATFGDNVSPISDTTIASALTQDADIAGVVKSRLRYALLAAAIALVAYAALGSAGASLDERPDMAANPIGLVMLIVLVVALLLRGHHLLEGLIFGILTRPSSASSSISSSRRRFFISTRSATRPAACSSKAWSAGSARQSSRCF